jgi:aspartate aminotransferase
VAKHRGHDDSVTGDCIAFTSHLKDHLILAAPAVAFGCPGWFRLAYCVPMATIEKSEGAFTKARESWQG